MTSIVTVGQREIRVQGKWLRIARLHGDSYKYMDDPEPVLAGMRSFRPRIDLFTFTQPLPETEPKFHYPMEWDNLAAQRISTFDHWWTKQVDAKTRNMVRKAEKKRIATREVRLDRTLVEGIFKVYNETAVRQGKRFPHYGKSIDAIEAEEATHLDSSVFIGAYLDDELIGFVKLVFDERGCQAGLMNILSLTAHRDKAPTNALIAQAVRSAIARGATYLVYARFNYGKKGQDSLTEFKRNNGFQKVLLPRYYVPLTKTGAVAFRLGMHRGLTDLLPASVTAGVRTVRRFCYGG